MANKKDEKTRDKTEQDQKKKKARKKETDTGYLVYEKGNKNGTREKDKNYRKVWNKTKNTRNNTTQKRND